MPTDIYRKIFDRSPIASQVFSPDGTLRQVNAAWRSLWKVPADVAIEDYNVFADPQLADSGAPAFRRALAGETVLLPVYRYDPAASGLPGRPRWLRTHIFPSLADNGSVEAVIVLHEDLTETKDTLDRYQALVDNAREFVFVVQDGKFVFANRATLAATSYSETEFFGKDFLSFIHPDDRALTAKRYRHRILGKLDQEPTFRLRFIDKSGDTHWIEGMASRIEWDGRPAVLCLCNDVTSRIQMEQELRQSEERFRLIAQSSSDMIFLFDKNGTLHFVNRAAETLLHRPAAELTGTSLQQLVHPEDHRQLARLTAALQAGTSAPPCAIRMVRSDGSILPVEISCFVFASQQHTSPLYGAVLRDISQRLEEERVREQRLQSLGLLAGGIAHDFNNLLTAITGNLSLLAMQLPANDDLQRHVAEIDKACGRAQRLTGQLLTFARGGSPVKETTDLAGTIRDSATFILRGSPVAPRFSIPDDLWLAEADTGQIGQVIQNIVLNAAHAMPDGGTVRITACNRFVDDGEIEGLPAGRYVAVAITDQGVGIPANILDRIFDPYFTTKKTGSGLGLAAAYSIVKKHDGTITVDSSPSKGSTFTIFLPATEGEKAPAAGTEEEETAPGARTGSILVMDDDEVVRSLAATIASYLGYEVATSQDGAEAVALYTERYRSGAPFDAVILDLTVPGGMGGREAAKRILAIDPTARLIASSGYATDDVMAAPERYGFAGLLPKPYRAADFQQALTSVLTASSPAPSPPGPPGRA